MRGREGEGDRFEEGQAEDNDEDTSEERQTPAEMVKEEFQVGEVENPRSKTPEEPVGEDATYMKEEVVKKGPTRG